jgi:hypothetical protein
MTPLEISIADMIERVKHIKTHALDRKVILEDCDYLIAVMGFIQTAIEVKKK